MSAEKRKGGQAGKWEKDSAKLVNSDVQKKLQTYKI
jgi:hypothetical protein